MLTRSCAPYYYNSNVRRFTNYKRLHIGFEDPASATGTDEEIMAVFRTVRDEIKKKMQQFYLADIKGMQLPKVKHRIKNNDMKTFEKYLTLWVMVCIALGMMVGRYIPDKTSF